MPAALRPGMAAALAVLAAACIQRYDDFDVAADAEDCASCAATLGFVKLSPDGFWMGSPDGCPQSGGYPGICSAEPGRSSDETLHYVRLTHWFELQEREVTQGDWKAAFQGWNPSRFPQCGDKCPVESISWYDAAAYANWLSGKAGLQQCYMFADVACADGTAAGADAQDCLNDEHKGIAEAAVTLADEMARPYDCQGFRLPTESEWEYAARAGTMVAYHDGREADSSHLACQSSSHLADIAWYCGNDDPKGTKPAGKKKANAWGLSDMSGNVWEWCWDGYAAYPAGAPDAPALDPVGGGDALRVARGGSWYATAAACRSAYRMNAAAGNRHCDVGLRLARTLRENDGGGAR